MQFQRACIRVTAALFNVCVHAGRRALHLCVPASLRECNLLCTRLCCVVCCEGLRRRRVQRHVAGASGADRPAACRCLQQAGAGRRATCSLAFLGRASGEGRGSPRAAALQQAARAPRATPRAQHCRSVCTITQHAFEFACRIRTAHQDARHACGAAGALLLRGVCPVICVRCCLGRVLALRVNSSGHSQRACSRRLWGGIPSDCVSWFLCEGLAAALPTRPSERWSLHPLPASLVAGFLVVCTVCRAAAARQLLQNKQHNLQRSSVLKSVGCGCGAADTAGDLNPFKRSLLNATSPDALRLRIHHAGGGYLLAAGGSFRPGPIASGYSGARARLDVSAPGWYMCSMRWIGSRCQGGQVWIGGRRCRSIKGIPGCRAPRRLLSKRHQLSGY